MRRPRNLDPDVMPGDTVVMVPPEGGFFSPMNHPQIFLGIVSGMAATGNVWGPTSIPGRPVSCCTWKAYRVRRKEEP